MYAAPQPLAAPPTAGARSPPRHVQPRPAVNLTTTRSLLKWQPPTPGTARLHSPIIYASKPRNSSPGVGSPEPPQPPFRSRHYTAAPPPPTETETVPWQRLTESYSSGNSPHSTASEDESTQSPSPLESHREQRGTPLVLTTTLPPDALQVPPPVHRPNDVGGIHSDVLADLPRPLDWAGGELALPEAPPLPQQGTGTSLTSTMGNATEAVHALEHQYIATRRQLEVMEAMHEKLDWHNEEIEAAFTQLQQRVNALRHQLTHRVYSELRRARSEVRTLRQYAELLLCDYHSNMRKVGMAILSEVSRCTRGEPIALLPIFHPQESLTPQTAEGPSSRARSRMMHNPTGWLDVVAPSRHCLIDDSKDVSEGIGGVAEGDLMPTQFAPSSGGVVAGPVVGSQRDFTTSNHGRAEMRVGGTPFSTFLYPTESLEEEERLDPALSHSTPTAAADTTTGAVVSAVAYRELQQQLLEAQRQLTLSEGKLRVTQRDAEKRIRNLQEVFKARAQTLSEEVLLLRSAMNLQDPAPPIAQDASPPEQTAELRGLLQTPPIVREAEGHGVESGVSEGTATEGTTTHWPAPRPRSLSEGRALERRVKAAVVRVGTRHLNRPDRYSLQHQIELEEAARRLLARVQYQKRFVTAIKDHQSEMMTPPTGTPPQPHGAPGTRVEPDALSLMPQPLKERPTPTDVAKVAQGMWAERLLAQRGLS